MQTSITYKSSGVDIESGDKLVEIIKPFAKATMRKEVLAGIGGFGAMFEIAKKFEEPVLVSGTDGVGTKLKLAFELNKHDTIGIDLVAMSVNDMIRGIANGCKESGCSLIGGETAEMPGMYPDGEYDLAGFAVGVVEKSKIIDGTKIKEGDVIIGLSSSGFHSNGYSLVRKVIASGGLDLSTEYSANISWGEAILAPTRLYVKPILDLLKVCDVHGMSHITGGGITGNLPRVFPSHLAAQIQLDSLPQEDLFTWVKKVANLDTMQMLETFNCGIGYAVVVDAADEDIVHALMKTYSIDSYAIGTMVSCTKADIFYK